jgi:hypothetical protein
MTATSNLLYVLDKSSTADDQIDWMPASGGASTEVGADTSGTAGVLYGLAIDSVDSVYFVTSLSAGDSYIYEEPFGSAPQFSSPLGGGAIATSLDDAATSVALNASDDILYFTSGTGFYEEKFGAGFSGTPQEVQLASFSGLAAAGDGAGSTAFATQQIAFDQADHSAYFASPGYNVLFTTNTAGTKIVTVSSSNSN